VVREIYNPERHFNEEIVQDDHDPGQRWAVNQIQWIIRKVCVRDIPPTAFPIILT
jgi:hypothetical protein